MKIRGIVIVISAVLSFYTLTLQAQDNDYSKSPENLKKSKNADLRDRIVVGGGGTLNFGPETYISLLPKVGYYLTENLIAGAGLTYIYERTDLNKIYGRGGVYKTSVFGGSIFADYFLLENFFIHAEPELLNFNYFDNITGNTERTWVTSIFAGAGIAQKIGKKGYAQIMLLYNLNYNEFSPYTSPWVPRVNILF